jgi:hypothetical protein
MRAHLVFNSVLLLFSDMKFGVYVFNDCASKLCPELFVR